MYTPYLHQAGGMTENAQDVEKTNASAEEAVVFEAELTHDG